MERAEVFPPSLLDGQAVAARHHINLRTRRAGSLPAEEKWSRLTAILTGEVLVFPSLIAQEHHRDEPEIEVLSHAAADERIVLVSRQHERHVDELIQAVTRAASTDKPGRAIRSGAASG